MTTRDGLSIRVSDDHHLIDIPPSPAIGGNANALSQTDGEIHTEWLRGITSASRSTAVLNDLIGRTPTLWYLGERPATILRPRSRRAGVKALHEVRAVAIGPYHRGDRGLAFDDESKLPFLRYLREQCVAALGSSRGRFRDEFKGDDDDADMLRDEEKFVKMLLLDSSFVLVFGLMFGRTGARGDGAEERAAASVTREHVLGSVKCTDEEVVHFFRDIAAEAAGVRKPEEYSEMLSAVARHRRRRASRWCGDFILHFFPSPWVSVSLAVVAGLIIVPAMLQTIYTILGYQSSR